MNLSSSADQSVCVLWRSAAADVFVMPIATSTSMGCAVAASWSTSAIFSCLKMSDNMMFSLDTIHLTLNAIAKHSTPSLNGHICFICGCCLSCHLLYYNNRRCGYICMFVMVMQTTLSLVDQLHILHNIFLDPYDGR